MVLSLSEEWHKKVRANDTNYNRQKGRTTKNDRTCMCQQFILRPNTLAITPRKNEMTWNNTLILHNSTACYHSVMPWQSSPDLLQ